MPTTVEILQKPLFDKIPERPRFKPGDRVRWWNRELGLCQGVIAASWPNGYTAYRDGVKRTKPHFLDLDAPGRLL